MYAILQKIDDLIIDEGVSSRAAFILDEVKKEIVRLHDLLGAVSEGPDFTQIKEKQND